MPLPPTGRIQHRSQHRTRATGPPARCKAVKLHTLAVLIPAELVPPPQGGRCRQHPGTQSPAIVSGPVHAWTEMLATVKGQAFRRHLLSELGQRRCTQALQPAGLLSSPSLFLFSPPPLPPPPAPNPTSSRPGFIYVSALSGLPFSRT